MILIACALEKELAALQPHLAAGCEFAVTGLGCRRTRHRLGTILQGQSPSLLIFAGTAGQLDPSLELGQVVLAEEWCLEDGSCIPLNQDLADRLRERGWTISGRGLTVSTPVVRRKSRLALHKRFGALVCDMESAGALDVAARCEVPCLVAKVVSDTADSGTGRFWTRFDENMERLARQLEALIGSLFFQASIGFWFWPVG